MPAHNIYMARCLELAQNGLGFTAPNPLVGSVVVYNDRIIGEGYHQAYGSCHAEVNAIKSVKDKNLLAQATLYVNLEPCAHNGKTPPCTDLIIEHKIPKVAIGCKDIFIEVNGKGIEKLRNAGVDVELGIMEPESREINKRFFTFHGKKRPYVVLKWAQTGDGFVAREDFTSQWISNDYSRLLVHQWRSEEAGIMVGTNTARYDNPQLTARDMKTRHPIRIALDRNLSLDKNLYLFDGQYPTIVFTTRNAENRPNLEFVKIDFDAPDMLEQVLHALYERSIQSVFMEGGSVLHQSFIKKGLWDEARVIEAPHARFGKGIQAPLMDIAPSETYEVANDRLFCYRN